MIKTETPELVDEDLKILTPWWDVTTKYIVAAMMAIALTSIAVQVTQDNLVCLPVIDCSGTIVQNLSVVNVPKDNIKICQSLTPKNAKKKVLTKMVDRRSYDYVDSVCFQELSWFAKFFSLIIFGEAIVLLIGHLLWTKLPFSFSVLNNFVILAKEAYSLQGTLENTSESHDAPSTSDAIPLMPQNGGTQSTNNLETSVPEADALKSKTLIEKASKFKKKYTSSTCCPSLFCLYIICTCFQLFFCSVSVAINLIDHEDFFNSNEGVHFKCTPTFDEYIFQNEYDNFDCAHKLALYFQIVVILFLILLFSHLILSFLALGITLKNGRSYKFNSHSENKNDFAFLFFLLKQHNQLFADSVSPFFDNNAKTKNSKMTGNNKVPTTNKEESTHISEERERQHLT